VTTPKLTPATLTKRACSLCIVSLIATLASLPVRAGFIDEIIFFGDSLSDTGNVWYALDRAFPSAPYNQGSAGAGPDFTGGQWSDPLGPSWSSVFAGFYGLPATPSFVGGNNYAWGGARTGANPGPDPTPWLDQQVGLYIATGTLPSANTLASLMIGGNDVANNIGNPAAINNGITSVTNSILALYGRGIRNLLVATVPDVGVTPEFQVQPETIRLLASEGTVAWNAALIAALEDLVLPGADIDVLDLFALGKDDELLAGLDNTTDPCFTGLTICDDPASYFYWDSFHPSSTSHALIAAAARDAVVTEPAGPALLFTGLVLMLLGSHRRAPGQ
jgi:outer membrane lipase/esterase